MVKEDRYTLTVTVDADLATTDERVRAALGEEGFGILSEIDVRAKLIEKLDVDIDDYKILGACSPPLANKAIGADPDIGALLPCNVLLRRNPEGGTDVVAVDPERMIGMTGIDQLTDLACDAKDRIRRALKAVSS